LSELLTSYTLHGLPKMPDCLTRGRPHYDQSAFTLERHWTDIVANHDRLNKRQRDQQEAVWELLSTEVEYLRKLRVIIDVSTRIGLTVVITRKLSYRKGDRAMHPMCGCPENFRESLSTPTATFPDIFHGLLFRSIL